MGGQIGGAHCPTPPAISAPHLLRSLFFSFRLFLGLRDLQEEPKAAETGAGAALGGGGGLPWPPESHRGCRRSDGEDLPGAGLHRASNHSGAPSWLWGDRGGRVLVGEARWEGVAVGRGGTGSARHPQGSGPLSPGRLPCPASAPLSPSAHPGTLCLFFTSFTLKQRCWQRVSAEQGNGQCSPWPRLPGVTPSPT